MTVELPYPKWQRPCADAVMELDVSKLLDRVTAAEAAIFLRLQELKTAPDGAEERSALADAMKTLRALKRGKLNLPY